MVTEVLVCLDGSTFAETILPYARAIARSVGAQLTLLRVAEHENEFTAGKKYVHGLAQRYRGLEGRFRAEGKVRRLEGTTAATILKELKQNPGALAAITTHGHSGVVESLLGSVASSIIQGAGRPVLVYRPRVGGDQATRSRQATVQSVVVTLDGSEFSQKILPFAAEMAKLLNANLQLVQVLSANGSQPQIASQLRDDVLESSYLHRQAREVQQKYEINADWDVLHGNPAEAIIDYLKGRNNILLAMTTQARAGLERTFFGSVSSECLRHAGMPMLVYCPAI